MSIFSIDGLSLAFGSHVLLERASFALEKAERVCLIGRNGTGKTTLMRLIQGEMQADEGDVRQKDGLLVSSLPQEVPHEARGSVFDIVASGLGDTAQLLQSYHQVLHAVANGDELALKTMESIQQQLEAVDGWSLVQRVEATISKLQLDADSLIENLSGGLKRRVMLAKALVIEPDILMLDEPTNHLDINAILWLENFLKSYQGCVLFITHDRVFLQNVATRILELDRGQLVSFSGDYQNYLRRKEEMLHAEEKANELFDKKLAEEEVWIRQGIKARRTRNEGRVRALKAMREERGKRREVQGKARLELDDKHSSGKIVVEVDNISYQYDTANAEKRSIVKHFSSTIMRGDRIGIIGPNGVGKTTLLNLLLGELKPQTGQVTLGTKLEIAYFDQLRNQLDEEKSIIDNIGEGREFVSINGRERHVFSYLRDFLFSSQRAKVSVKALSGGERNRLLLAKLFTRPANLLVLDEPTNDLDSDTLELLESLLMDYKGTLLIVSHDRAFLNNVITSSLVFEEDGLNEYVGGYDDWLRQRQPPAAEVTSTPKTAQEKTRTTAQTAQIKSIKLSYKEQRELDNLPHKIEQLEQQQSDLETIVADPGFYQQEQTLVAQKLTELDSLNQQLEAVYDRWEQLESKKSGA